MNPKPQPANLRANAPAAGVESRSAPKGGHGFDPQAMPEMKAIFFAEGPDIGVGVKLPVFENVNVYPFLANILDLRAPITDGRLGIISNALTNSPITLRTAKDDDYPHSTVVTPSGEEPFSWDWA